MATGIPVSAGELVDLSYLNAVARAHYRKTSAKTVNTTTAATDLLNGEITLGANVLGSTRCARLTAWGDTKQNSGAGTAGFRFQLVFGATTILDTGAPNVGVFLNNSATRFGWRIVCEIVNLGATNAQLGFMQMMAGCSANAAQNAAFTTGEGSYTSTTSLAWMNGMNTAAEDTTSAKTLVLNVINPSASVNCETKLLGAIVEIV